MPSSIFHCVFSTKERRKIIAPDLQARLWAYLGGIAREHEMKALGVGGMGDHAHNSALLAVFFAGRQRDAGDQERLFAVDARNL